MARNTPSLRKLAPLLCALVLALSSSACVQKPEVGVRSVDLAELSLRSMDIVLNLDLANPNSFAIPLSKVNWNLDLSGTPFADGAVRVKEEIPASASAQIDVPLKISYQKALGAVTNVIRGKKIAYALSGDLGFDTSAGVIAVPFSVAGQWDNPMSLLSSLHEPLPSENVKVEIPRL